MQSAPEQLMGAMPQIATREQAAQYLSDVLFRFIRSVHAEGGRRAEIIDALRAQARQEAQERVAVA